MMPVSYMTPAGVWACSCQSEADKPDPALIPAPDGGGEGLRWDGAGWVAFAPPPDSCTKRQLFLAMTDAEFEAIEAALATLPPRLRAAMDAAQQIDRLHPHTLMMMQGARISPERRDELFILAAAAV